MAVSHILNRQLLILSPDAPRCVYRVSHGPPYDAGELAVGGRRHARPGRGDDAAGVAPLLLLSSENLTPSILEASFPTQRRRPPAPQFCERLWLNAPIFTAEHASPLPPFLSASLLLSIGVCVFLDAPSGHGRDSGPVFGGPRRAVGSGRRRARVSPAGLSLHRCALTKVPTACPLLKISLTALLLC
jgi:hypothetical protein